MSTLRTVRRGHIVAGAVILSALGGSAIYLGMRAARPTLTMPRLATSEEIGIALRSAGLAPANLAAAGVTHDQVAAMFTAVDAMEGTPVIDLAAAEDAIQNGRRSIQQLTRLVQSGKATQNDLSALEAATAALATNEAARGAILVSLFTAATAHLDSEERTRLTNIHARQGFGLDAAYRCNVDDPAEATELRQALAAKATALKWGETVPQAAATTIADADSICTAARTHLNANLASVTTAWNTQAGGE